MTAFGTIQADIDVYDVTAHMVVGTPRVIVDGPLPMQFDADSAREFAASLIHAAAEADALAAEAGTHTAVGGAS